MLFPEQVFFNCAADWKELLLYLTWPVITAREDAFGKFSRISLIHIGAPKPTIEDCSNHF
jgi:hypothetical protein